MIKVCDFAIGAVAMLFTVLSMHSCEINPHPVIRSARTLINVWNGKSPSRTIYPGSIVTARRAPFEIHEMVHEASQ